MAHVRRTFSTTPSNSVVALLPCADGWVAISPREEHQWTRWLEVMGRPAWSDEPRFRDRISRDRNWSELYPLLAEWSRVRTKTEVFQSAQEQRVACLPLGTATDLLASAQLAARDFFVEIDDPHVRAVLPGRPYHLSTEAARVDPPPRVARDTVDHHQRPLDGVRVVDFSWVLTGPICTRYLASLGAEIIKVESATRADLSQPRSRLAGAEPRQAQHHPQPQAGSRARAGARADRSQRRRDRELLNWRDGAPRPGLCAPAAQQPAHHHGVVVCTGPNRTGPRAGRVRHVDPVPDGLGSAVGSSGLSTPLRRWRVDRPAHGGPRNVSAAGRDPAPARHRTGHADRPVDGRNDHRRAARADPGLVAWRTKCSSRAAIDIRSTRRKAPTRRWATTAGSP